MMLRPATSRRKQEQGGFILLVVFLMAAAIALTMYAQLPRVAFESEREKEQLLIERGEQYIRAIQLYIADNNGQWPQTIDDLEKGKNKRYLRRRYVDPYTGKDDWRIIHTNGAQLTDSLVQKLTTDQAGASTNASNSQQNQEQQVNAAVLARPSDTTLPGAQQFNVVTPQTATPVGAPVPVNTPGQVPGVVGAGFVQGAQQFPGQQFPGQPTPAGVNNAGAGFQPQFPGQQFPGQPGPTGATNNASGFQPQFPGQQFPGQQAPPGAQTFPGANQQQPPPGFQFGPNGQLIPAQVTAPLPGQAAPGANPSNLPGNAGVNAITQLLTTPRTPPAGVNTQQNNAVGGGGIAGVASKHTGPSIKVYKERQKYEEWEFVYTRPAGATAAGVGGAQPGGQPGAPGAPGAVGQAGQAGQPGRGQPAGGFTGNGFGQTGFGTSGFGNPGTQPAGGGRGGTNPGTLPTGGATPGAGRGR